jgi:two-component system, OmpR family, osmolarity sensor histidine kinase EnvZ
VTLPRRRLWRVFFWIAIVAILIEVLGLTSTFVEQHRRRIGSAAGLLPDQIAAIVHLWPSLQRSQRQDVLAAISWAGLSYRVISETPVVAPTDAHVREVEDAVRKRLGGGAEADSVVALIRARAFGNDRHAVNWALSSEPIRVYVHLAGGDWLLTEARGDLLTRFLGLPTGYWIGVIGLLLLSGVLWAILREGRVVERIAQSVETFASTGVPQPIVKGGSPEIAALARQTVRMQEQVARLLSERNAMLGAIAHDINTYIQRLKLRLDILEDPNQVEKARHDLDAMSRMVEDALLVAVHANPLKSKQTVDLAAVVAHEAEAARMAGGDIMLQCEGSGPFLVAGDHSALSRALSNVIGNAMRYGDRARVWLRRNRDMVEVIVDDDGPGIPPSERHAVFTAFHRAESSRNRSTGGTGLGLAIAFGIVERQHGGSIEITDAPGGGARLKISVPGDAGRVPWHTGVNNT